MNLDISNCSCQRCFYSEQSIETPNNLVLFFTDLVFCILKYSNYNLLLSLPLSTFSPPSRYIHYEKHGEYGDDKANKYHVRLSSPVPETGLTPERRAILDALVPGDIVDLEWHHDYVTTKYKGGGSSLGPQRPIVHLAKK